MEITDREIMSVDEIERAALRGCRILREQLISRTFVKGVKWLASTVADMGHLLTNTCFPRPFVVAVKVRCYMILCVAVVTTNSQRLNCS